MKQKVQFTGKNIRDIFALPCVYDIQKNISMDYGFPISQRPQDMEVSIRVDLTVYSDIEVAHYGDWIVEEDDGSWHVEKGGEK